MSYDAPHQQTRRDARDALKRARHLLLDALRSDEWSNTYRKCLLSALERTDLAICDME